MTHVSTNSIYPNTEVQLCVIHQIRNSIKYVASKHHKAFMADLKSVCIGRYQKRRQKRRWMSWRRNGVSSTRWCSSRGEGNGIICRITSGIRRLCHSGPRLILDIITDADREKLVAIKKYITELKNLDLSTAPDIEWPVAPV